MLFGFDFNPTKVVAVSLGAFSLYFVKEIVCDRYRRNSADAKRNNKIASLTEAKAKFALYLEQHQIPQVDIEMITNLPFLELVKKLKTQELPPAYVLLAYQHKAFNVDKKLNCVVEFLYPELTDINIAGPLGGVPISVKECIAIKGLDHCFGYSCYIGLPREKDSVALKVIRDLGGVPFVRTTVPQTMMSTQCSNPINGVTLNPLRPDRTPHGSSGGEGALIGGGGSPLGFGTDIGGSIRLPAAMCGLVGFKPTAGRLSYRYISELGTTKPIAPAWGPISRDVASCRLMMEALINSPLMHTLDPDCPPVPFQKISDDRRLRIGYFLKFDSIIPVPAVRRALLGVRDKLVSRGHQLVEWTPPFTAKEYVGIFLRSIFSDGLESIKRCLSHDKIDRCIMGIYRLGQVPWYLRWWIAFKLKLVGNWEAAEVFNALRGFSTVYDLESHLSLLSGFRRRVMDSLQFDSIDVLLCPAAGFAAALPINPPYSTTGMLAFQSLANTLNAPAGCMPSGCVVEGRDIQVLEQAVTGVAITSAMDEEEAKFYTGYKTLSPSHRHMLPLQVGTNGLPIPIQLMALPWQDELCLYAMREVELAVR